MNKSTTSEKAQVAALEYLLDGKEYCVLSDENRGRQIALVIPWDRYYGTPRYLILWRALRLMAMAIWKDVIS